MTAAEAEALREAAAVARESSEALTAARERIEYLEGQRERLNAELAEAHRTCGILARCLIARRGVAEVDPAGPPTPRADDGRGPGPGALTREKMGEHYLAARAEVEALVDRFGPTVYQVAASLAGQHYAAAEKRRRERRP